MPINFKILDVATFNDRVLVQPTPGSAEVEGRVVGTQRNARLELPGSEPVPGEVEWVTVEDPGIGRRRMPVFAGGGYRVFISS